jgi:DnaK suppressor protein
MNQKELDYFRNHLMEWLDDLLARADNTVVALKDQQEESSADPLDRATADTVREYTLRISNRESILIKKIKQSLADIENGEYGICEMCGEEIALERLKARPVAKHCIDCKTRIEAIEKLTGT